MLGVDRVVLDRGVEPQAVALLAVVEGALERARCCGSLSVAPRPPRRLRLRAPSRRAILVVVLLLGVALLGGELAGPLGFGFGGFELGGDQRVILGAQVDLLGVVPAAGALGRAPRRSRARSGA